MPAVLRSAAKLAYDNGLVVVNFPAYAVKLFVSAIVPTYILVEADDVHVVAHGVAHREYSPRLIVALHCHADEAAVVHFASSLCQRRKETIASCAMRCFVGNRPNNNVGTVFVALNHFGQLV